MWKERKEVCRKDWMQSWSRLKTREFAGQHSLFYPHFVPFAYSLLVVSLVLPSFALLKCCLTGWDLNVMCYNSWGIWPCSPIVLWACCHSLCNCIILHLRYPSNSQASLEIHIYFLQCTFWTPMTRHALPACLLYAFGGKPHCKPAVLTCL